MSYSGNEDSIRSAEPIELFKFVVANDQYLYTSQEDTVVDGLDSYLPIPIQRSDLQFEGEVSKSSLKVSMPRSEDIANLFIVQPPAIPVTLFLYRFHASDGVGTKVTIWNGRVIDVSWSGNDAVFNCESVYTSINRQGLQRKHGPTCPYTLYDTQCGVNELSFQLATTVESMSGTTVTSAAFATQPDNYFSGGYLSFQIPAKPTEYRAITKHIGDTITIGYSIPGLAVGSDIVAFPGCAHNLDTCFNKFGNGLRYGGFPYMPGVNPFNGTTLF